ncbi:MAG: hypothetical protein ACLP8A_02330 [Methylovirgula sp.]
MSGAPDDDVSSRQYRGKTSAIARKCSHTLIRTLRLNYGDDFALDRPESAKLIEVLDRLDTASLSKLVSNYETDELKDKIAITG